MRADLARREPEWLARWAKERQYERILEARLREEAPDYVLHDGPPYATGAHPLRHRPEQGAEGHRRALAADHGPASGVPPGLGLPRPADRAAGREEAWRKDAKALDAVAFRAALPGARAEVRRRDAHRVQAARLRRQLGRSVPDAGQGLRGDDRAPAGRASSRRGLVYRDKKPVHWCLVHRTALAEAEVEYDDHSSPSIYVRFPIVGDLGKADPRLREPARGVRHLDDDPLDAAGEPGRGRQPRARLRRDPARRRIPDRRGRPGRGVPGRDRHRRAAGVVDPDRRATGCGRWRGRPYTPPFPRPTPTPSATTASGSRATPRSRPARAWCTPRPATAPTTTWSGASTACEIFAPVDERGRFTTDVAASCELRGLNVFEANPKIVADLAERGLLLNKPGEKFRHQYPLLLALQEADHLPRHRAVVRPPGRGRRRDVAAPRALAEIERTQWIPAWGQNRIRGMIEARPDWCLSRQRVWGVPIPAFRCNADAGRICSTPTVIEHVADLFAREGSNAWFTRAGGRAAARADRACAVRRPGISTSRTTSSTSGSSRACRGRRSPRASWCRAGEKVDLYLEGADQHRGWFHSSLLTAVGDARPGALQGGADPRLGARRARQGLLEVGDREGARGGRQGRLRRSRRSGWRRTAPSCCACGPRPADYQGDVVFSKTILDQLGESYRKIRNTCRYLLSNLYDFVPAARSRWRITSCASWTCWRWACCASATTRSSRPTAASRSTRWCGCMNDYVVTVSAEYLDPVKDALYCEATDVARAAQRADRALRDDCGRSRIWMAPDPLLHRPGRGRRARRARPASRSTCTAQSGPRSTCRASR